MGEQLIKTVDAIKVGDLVVSLETPRLYEVCDVDVEYDHGDPHCVWLRLIDVMTGDKIADPLSSAAVSYPLSEMEVIAWASK